MKLLNLGCGDVFHPDWINIDISSNSKFVRSHDLRKGIPFADNFFDGVYCSHVLEHIKFGDVPSFLAEVRGVLKPGGIFRVVVPDLEDITRKYLENIKTENRKWMTIELLDQLTRDRSGGLMASYLKNKNVKNNEFVVSRMGEEAEKIWRALPDSLPFFQKLKGKNLNWYWKKTRVSLAHAFLHVLGGKDFNDSFSEGLFRRSGEVHQWMYDRVSLDDLLTSNGFSKVEVTDALNSRISRFKEFNLDTNGGKIRKPDSLFIEAQK